LISQIKNTVTDLRSFNGYYSNNIEQCKQRGKEILDASITELESFGLPEKKEKNNESGVNISLTQNQTLNINIILNALEDELSKSQLNEVKEIIENEGSKSEKRKKIIEKLGSFGKDVASNIIANILLNPNLWG
jgi:hypothetical protein